MPEGTIDLGEWYTATQAAERLTANSGRKISADYVRSLARYGRVRTLALGSHANLYYKADIDPYVVEDRGAKSARAKRLKALQDKQESVA